MHLADKAASERVIMRIEPVIHAAVHASIASARAPDGGIVRPERLRTLIEDAVNRYHAETRRSAGPSPLSVWSGMTGRRG